MNRTWTRIVSRWDGQRYVTVESESSYFWDDRPSAKCKASQQEKSVAASQQSFMQTMQQAYQTQFAGQSAILRAMQKAWEPILAAGPNQYGFSGAEDTAYRSQATEGTAGEYAKAARAVQQSQAAQGGGNEYLPSGVNEQVKASIAQGAAADEASKQLGITRAGYEQGRTNFGNASNVLGGVAAQMNPLGYAGTANSSGQAAFDSQHKISQENSSWMGALGGVVGALGGGALSSALTGSALKADSGMGSDGDTFSRSGGGQRYGGGSAGASDLAGSDYGSGFSDEFAYA